MRHYFTKNATNSLTRKFCLKGSLLISSSVNTPLQAIQPAARMYGVSQPHAQANSQVDPELVEKLSGMQKQQHFLGSLFGRKQQRSPKDEEKVEIDVSDLEFEDEDLGWGGITRPGGEQHLSGEEFPEEEAMGTDWESDHDNDDDDDHGGHMMPLPRLF